MMSSMTERLRLKQVTSRNWCWNGFLSQPAAITSPSCRLNQTSWPYDRHASDVTLLVHMYLVDQQMKPDSRVKVNRLLRVDAREIECAITIVLALLIASDLHRELLAREERLLF